MRVIIQRVSEAAVHSEGKVLGKIGNGLMILVGIEDNDSDEDIQWISKKITQLRIFSDEEGKMNASILDIGGDILLVSQFTLHAKTKKGNRPSYIRAAHPDLAIPCYENLINQLETDLKKPIATGKFGADMQVSLTNNGPVTLFIDTKNKE